MFDPRHVLEPSYYSDQTAALVKAHRKALPQCARNGRAAGLLVSKLCRFRASDLGHCLPHAVNSEQLSVPPHHS
jgi:hypothetical protein